MSKRKTKFSAEMEYITREGTKTIHDLGTGNLEYIFGMLSLFDRLTIERVCIHWKHISRKSWQRSASRILELPNPGINMFDLALILRISGPRLTHIDFSQYAGNLNETILHDITHYCTNVEFMDLSSIKLSPVAIKYLEPNFKNITELRFGSCIKNYNESLSHLFLRNDKMKSLKIESISTNFKFLTESPIGHTLEKLILEDIDSDFSSLCHAADKYKNLNTLFIKDCDNIAEEILVITITKWKNIRHLQFSGNFNKIKSLNNISFLTYLQSLDVSFNQLVDDAFLKCIIKGCPCLYEVNISCCDSITKDGLKAIFTLPKLKYLNISYLSKIQEFHFMKMQDLEILRCCGCANLRTEDIATPLLGSLKIRILDISYCKQITNNILEIVELLTEIRTSKMLEINVYGTSIIINKYKRIPGVKIINHEETKGEISIDKLNDDCLRQIFVHLPLKDRLTVGSVCRKWNRINEKLWNNMTALSPVTVKQKNVTCKILNEVLNRCSKQVLHVDFSIFGTNTSNNIVKNVGLACNNLQSIIITDKLHLLDIGIFNLFKNIESITVGSNQKMKLEIVFVFLQKLKRLKIVNSLLYGRSLKKLSYNNLESLIIKGCIEMDRGELVSAIPRFTNLTHLSITNFDNSLSPSQKLKSTTITNLQLCDNLPDIIIEKMPNLHSLNVSNSSIFNDVSLEEICRHCKNLKELDISNCPKISNCGLTKLSYLKNLEHLSMNNLRSITDQKAKKLCNLKILECRNCINLYNAGLFDLLDTSPLLETLDLTNCRCITHHIINHALYTVKQANTFKVLKIYLGGTNVDKNEILDYGPYLKLYNLPYIKKHDLNNSFILSSEELFEDH